MGHPSSDAVINFDQVWSGGMDYRIGLQFRLLSQSAPSSGSFDPVQNIRLQIASPPPDRRDGTHWYEGLRVNDGTEDGGEFDRNNPAWRRLGVFAPDAKEWQPEAGVKNLREPDPGTLIFNEVIAVPLVESGAEQRTATTLLRSGEPVVGEVDHFLSVYYETPEINGVRLTTAAVTYHIASTLRFTKDAGPWFAASLSEFTPGKRSSADYIVAVGPG